MKCEKMPRKALKCVADVKIHSVSCPGVWLQNKDELYLSITMFGIHYHTKLLGPAFPVFIFEKFRFEKMFPSCADPADVATHLEGEELYFELVQESYPGGEMVLATYWSNARHFLFPHPSDRPSYSDSERELLMVKTMHFPGIIAPKIEFSTSTVIKESSKLSNLGQKYLSKSQGNLARGSIYTEKKAPQEDLQFYCTCRERFSPKPAKRVQPFVVRKVDSKLISRTPSSYPQRPVSKKRAVSCSPPSAPRINKWERSCTVCRLYKKYFGAQYVGHHHPPFSDRSCSCKAKRTIHNPDSSSSDEHEYSVAQRDMITTRPKSAQVYYRNDNQSSIAGNKLHGQSFGNQQKYASLSSQESSNNRSSSDSKDPEFEPKASSYNHRTAFQSHLNSAYEDLYNQATSAWIEDC